MKNIAIKDIGSELGIHYTTVSCALGKERNQKTGLNGISKLCLLLRHINSDVDEPECKFLKQKLSIEDMVKTFELVEERKLSITLNHES